jgi:hypothetical protein
VEQLGPVEIIEICRRMLHFVSGARAFVDETAHRFGIRGAQAWSLANRVVLVKPRVTGRNEVLLAKSLAIECRGEYLAATIDFAYFRTRHIPTRSL